MDLHLKNQSVLSDINQIKSCEHTLVANLSTKFHKIRSAVLNLLHAEGGWLEMTKLTGAYLKFSMQAITKLLWPPLRK